MRPRLIGLLAAGLLVVSCSDDGAGRAGPNPASDDGTARIVVPTTLDPVVDDITDADAPSTEPPSSAPSTSADVTATTEPNIDPTTTGAPTTVVLPPTMGNPQVSVLSVATFSRPVDLAVRPGDGRFYIVEQGGRVIRFDGSTSATVLDLADMVSDGGEQGLLGLAFDPTGDLAYLNYTRADGDTTIVEYPVDADGRFDVGGERILLVVDQPYGNHNAGDLEFGPDGMLYIGLGDGGSGGDPARNASNPATLLGSLLRIDPAPDGDRPYSIPSDNPFAYGTLDGVEGAPEVWAWGLRNPWKFAFDPHTEALWIADVGQNTYEEIDFVAPTDTGPAGWAVDFGWSAFEGFEPYNDDVADIGRFTPPVLAYEHGEDGCSISGGVPYNGSAIPELAGGYVYSDYCSGRLWALDLAGERNVTLLDGLDAVAAVRTGPDGEIYVVQSSGDVLRLVAA